MRGELCFCVCCFWHACVPFFAEHPQGRVALPAFLCKHTQSLRHVCCIVLYFTDRLQNCFNRISCETFDNSGKKIKPKTCFVCTTHNSGQNICLFSEERAQEISHPCWGLVNLAAACKYPCGLRDEKKWDYFGQMMSLRLKVKPTFFDIFISTVLLLFALA